MSDATVTLERCRSHERRCIPAAWEPSMSGTPEQVARHYCDSLTHAERCDSGYRMVFGDGDVWEPDQFLAAYYPA